MGPLAVIGGSGFSDPELWDEIDRETIETPYGMPSAPLLRVRGPGAGLVLLARHGVGHRIPPHRINYRANLWALRQAGVERVIGLAAVGGIGHAYGPGQLVIPDQIIDYTWGREHTFCDDDELRHVDFTEPYCDGLRQSLLSASRRARLGPIDGGVYGASQGPRLESAAEISRMERDGCHVVGMTGMPEAALARELDLCYGCVAFVVNWAAGKVPGEITMAEIESNLIDFRQSTKRLLGELEVHS